MGSFLHAQHGANYLNVAQTFTNGSFTAIGLNPGGGLRAYSVTGAASAWQAPVLLPDDYDLVISFRNTSASRRLPEWFDAKAQLMRAPIDPH